MPGSLQGVKVGWTERSLLLGIETGSASAALVGSRTRQEKNRGLFDKLPHLHCSGKKSRATQIGIGLLTRHHNQEIYGETLHARLPAYQIGKERGPLVLASHNNPVRFRNIWLRPLEEQRSPHKAGRCERANSRMAKRLASAVSRGTSQPALTI